MDASTSDPVCLCTYYSRAIEKPVSVQPATLSWAPVTVAVESCAINLTARGRRCLNANQRCDQCRSAARQLARHDGRAGCIHGGRWTESGRQSRGISGKPRPRLSSSLFHLPSFLYILPFCARNLSGASGKKIKRDMCADRLVGK